MPGNWLPMPNKKNPKDLTQSEVIHDLVLRGLLWIERDAGIYYGTAAGIILFAPDPSIVFPQCRFLADAYITNEPDGDPSDHLDIRGPLSVAVERAIAFIEKNTRHPIRVVGLNRVRLDEYPPEAIREALVNAAAHRIYEDSSRKTMIEVFSDRIIISSPGLPPAPLTIQKLRIGKYRPCSRNPILAQCLSYFHRIEERGSGFRRMREQMIDHGLDKPRLATDTGYFQVIFPGPGENIKRLRVPSNIISGLVTPSIEEQLTTRQKDMVSLLIRGEKLTSRKCANLFDITRDTANRDFKELVKLGIAQKVGSGRSTHYILQTRR